MMIASRRNGATKVLLLLCSVQCYLLFSAVIFPTISFVAAEEDGEVIELDDPDERIQDIQNMNGQISDTGASQETEKAAQEDSAKVDKTSAENDNSSAEDHILKLKPDHQLVERPPVFTLQHAHDLEQTLQYSQHPKSALLVIIAYKVSCPQSMQFLWNFQYAVQQAFESMGDAMLDDLDPIVVQLPVTEKTITILDQFEITHVPALFFLKEQGEVAWDDPSVVKDEEEDEIDLDLDDDDLPMVPLVYATKYLGPKATIEDLVHGMYHYITRLRYSTQSFQIHTYTGKEYLDSMTMRFESLDALQNTIRQYQSTLLRHVPIPINPLHSDEEIAWIRYLLDDPAIRDDPTYPVEPFYAICQCRSTDDPEEEYDDAPDKLTRRFYREFDQIATIMAWRRDTVICVLPEPSCGFEDDATNVANPRERRDGSIAVFTIDPAQDWKLQQKAVFYPFPIDLTSLEKKESDKTEAVDDSNEDEEDDEPRSTLKNTGTGIYDFVCEHLRPSILWLDRQMTAPIAFHHQYHRHAVLFVDFHRDTDENRLEMREAIRIFREECESRRFYFDNTDRTGHTERAPMVCLVVPSTDTRVLTNFGIDIWSPMDYEFTEKLERTRCMLKDLENNATDAIEDDPVCERHNKERKEEEERGDKKPFAFTKLLPVLLVTNERSDGTGIERFYLDPPVNKTSLSTFFDSIFNGTAQREVHSTSLEGTFAKIRNDEKFPSNKHGVFILNGESLPRFIQEHKDQHVLLNLHAPTCGHCKRFSIIWNELAALMRQIKWDDQVIVGRMDTTVNEAFIPGMVATWLPAMFYFKPGVVERPIDYENTKMAKEHELGGLSHVLDLTEWWLDEAGDTIDERELLKSLEDDTEDVNGTATV